jgi:hypothetical protein
VKPALRLCTPAGTRAITRHAAAGMLRATRVLQQRRIGYSVVYSRRTGIVHCEGPRGDWQLEHVRGAA